MPNPEYSKNSTEMDSSSPPKNAQSLLDFKDLATAAFRIRFETLLFLEK